ncbi:MAG: hypothetical protein SW019_25790 [Actinomycetota bacterium]|nr:hypothetical protein [Actinomycetota bacterium]
MTTAERFRETATRPAATVSIAGVPWPTYKVLALVLGLLTFATVAVVTAAAAPAVLSGAAVAALAWIVLGLPASARH